MLSGIEMEIVFKLVYATLIGAGIGVEREIHRRPGGLRTHALVCMGATLFTVVSFGFSGLNVDTSRIAAGIVTGIGFLGAGAIFKSEDKVHGLTTAAELWSLAAIGIAIGIGMYFAALAAAIIILIVLGPMRIFEKDALKTKRRK